MVTAKDAATRRKCRFTGNDTRKSQSTSQYNEKMQRVLEEEAYELQNRYNGFQTIGQLKINRFTL